MLALSQCPGIDPVKDSSAAIQAALNLKQPITWDCPVNHVTGNDPSKGMFLPPGFDITFTPQGSLTTDAFGFPALCAINANGTLRGAKINYTGTSTMASPSQASRWNDICARNWLVSNGMNPYTGSGGGTLWQGPTNTSALIAIAGASDVDIEGLTVAVPAGVAVQNLVVTAVAMNSAYALGEAMGTGSVHGAKVLPVLRISDFDFDGVMMGIVGGGDLTVERGVCRRYGDLVDATWPVNPWFAPPHLIYMGAGGKSVIRDVQDLGQYVGNPIARPAASGNCLSLKLALGNGTLVDGYYSRRLHGGMDILSLGAPGGGIVKNAFFLIDTSIMTCDGKSAAWGVRFPGPTLPYSFGAIQATIANKAAAAVPVLGANYAPDIIRDLTLLQGYTG